MTFVAGADHSVTINFTPKRWDCLDLLAGTLFGDEGYYISAIHYQSHRGPFAESVTVRSRADDEKWYDLTANGHELWRITDQWNAEPDPEPGDQADSEAGDPVEVEKQ